nr:MAG TPA: hypothetical protein [Caudoviricetes sp.]DAO60533.1 MAG TPA: hypothetical protein [Caudoviricetes sp.]
MRVLLLCPNLITKTDTNGDISRRKCLSFLLP